MQTQTRNLIRWMIRRDLVDVLRIEGESFEFPWSERDFTRCLSQHHVIGKVTEDDDGNVIAYVIYELHKHNLHILNFAVDAKHRRRGIGTRMIGEMIGRLNPQKRNRITLEIRETNLAAQLFFRELGFKARHVLRNFYDDTTEDAYHFAFRVRPCELSVKGKE